jgi:hypothetical protein
MDLALVDLIGLIQSVRAGEEERATDEQEEEDAETDVLEPAVLLIHLA